MSQSTLWQHRRVYQTAAQERLQSQVKANIIDTRPIASQLIIKLFDEIPEPSNPNIIEIFNQLTDPMVTRIDVVINSIGGNWSTSLMLYNMLMQLKPYCLVRTIGFGMVYSGAQLIYLAGSERIAAEGTNFLFHSSLIELGYDQSINHKDYLDKHINTEKRVMKNVLEHFLTQEELTQIFEYNKQLYMSDIEAAERGIVHQVGYVQPWTFEVIKLKPKSKNRNTVEEDEDE